MRRAFPEEGERVQKFEIDIRTTARMIDALCPVLANDIDTIILILAWCMSSLGFLRNGEITNTDGETVEFEG